MNASHTASRRPRRGTGNRGSIASMAGSRAHADQSAKTASALEVSKVAGRAPAQCARLPPSRWPSGSAPVAASASTLIARPRSASGTSSCIAVFEEASDHTQNTPPTDSARQDRTKREEPA